MNNFSGKLGRFDAREAFAEAAREVNPRPRPFAPRARLRPLINSERQTFAMAKQSWYFEPVMTTERIGNALDRIDRALARIETQAALARSAPKPGGTANAELVARHEALRERVSDGIAQLDSLIEGLPQ